MAEGGKPSPELLTAVTRARAIMASHPQVERVEEPLVHGNGMQLKLRIQVPMPSAWWAAGASPSGVNRYEHVRLDFPPLYPMDPPEVSLRPDFRRDLAHIQPWLTADGRPVPCIQDGKLAEFMQQQGLAGILNQTVSWLEHAAEDRLIDPVQGWEPLRRDSFNEFLVADADHVRGIVNRQGGFRFQEFEFFRREGSWLHGQIYNAQFPLNKDTIKEAVGSHRSVTDCWLGKSLALIVWPGKQPSGQPIICDRYVPETITDLLGLKKKARAFGCLKEFNDGLKRLAQCVKDCAPAGPFPLALVLCARRPFNLMGSDSNIELCCYTTDFHAKEAFPQGDDTPVRVSAHRDQITPELLTRLSGLPQQEKHLRWTLVGAGSLGSKIGLHLGRAGRGPSTIIDSAMMAPHNAARHALIPYTGDMQIMSMDYKARLLQQALAGLSQKSMAITDDAIKVLHSRELTRKAWPKSTWAVVNTTASLRTRAALCNPAIPDRVIESLLYAGGEIGVIATEGTGRNPDMGDLFTELYTRAAADEAMRRRLYPGEDENDLPRIIVGEGCGSATMQITDGRVSMYAAGVAEYLLQRQRDGLSEYGELLIGKLADTGLNVNWEHVSVSSVTVVTAENGAGWTVRISARAHEEIAQEVVRWPDAETGGVLLGRQDEVTKCFYVIDVLPAPEDSTRSRTEFELGVKGLKQKLDAYMSATNATLYCLGTWHSHLLPNGPSALDHRTAKAMGLARLAPSILLIHTPDGYRAVLADQATREGASA
jgi:hypothetical protein|tara:strand:+ start:4165 stop:6459 length:2295 start_codon:yes stop_codon:yes gene_type:complete